MEHFIGVFYAKVGIDVPRTMLKRYFFFALYCFYYADSTVAGSICIFTFSAERILAIVS